MGHAKKVQHMCNWSPIKGKREQREGWREGRERERIAELQSHLTTSANTTLV